jgi:DNA repair exonuclease SbcCD nuclease subunit
MFRFIHTGDLHLDSPFVGLSEVAPESVSQVLRDATFGAWRAVVSLAIESKADFVLVAGDTFEDANHTLRGQLRFVEGLGDLARAGISSFVVTGNHDHDGGWAPSVSWPEVSHRFPSGKVSSVGFDRDGQEVARVYGISYKTRDVRTNLAAKFSKDSGSAFAIGLLHANVGADPSTENYAPCSLENLRAAHMDYWALGHIHRPQVLCEPNPTIVYCGTPQGLDPSDTDPRGCFEVGVDDGGLVETTFHAIDLVRWQKVGVSISGVTQDDVLIDRVTSAVDAARSTADRSIVARVKLTGRGQLHQSLRKRRYLDDLIALVRDRLGESTPFAWLESIRDETRPDINIEDRRLADDFLGDVLKRFQEMRIVLQAQETGSEGNPDAKAMRDALDRLYEDPRARRLLLDTRPSGETLLRLLDRAEALVADRLSGED